MFTMLEYPISTLDGPDPEDMAPEPEQARCYHCGHEITTIPIIRIFCETDPDAQWSICEQCIHKGVNPCPS